MKKVYMAIFIALLGCSSCSKDNDEPAPEPPCTETVELSMADKSATAETKALYARLWDIQQTGFMFGHHDDLFYGRNGMMFRAILIRRRYAEIIRLYSV